MAVDDIFAEASFGLEEFLADPEHVLLFLTFQGYARLDAGVHKEEVATREGRAELLKKRKMLRRKRLPQPFDQLNLLLRRRIHCRVDAVGNKGQQASVATPFLQPCRVLEDLEQEHFVIALEAHCLMRLRALDQEINHSTRVRAPVDIVAKKHLDRSFGSGPSKVGVDHG